MRVLARVINATLACILAFLLIPFDVKAANGLEDGLYSIEYEVLQVESDSVSIANDYFLKPASLIVIDGKQYIEMTINQSEWVKSLQVESGQAFLDVQVIDVDEENNKRTVRFAIDNDVSEPILMRMHVHIEELVPTYDHQYTVRYVYDLDSLELIDATPSIDLGMKEDERNRYTVFIYTIIVLIILIIIYVTYQVIKERRR